MIQALLAGLFIQAQGLLPFPGLHSPFHWAEMILQRQHKRELCGPSKCAFSAGGVRRSGRWKVGWEGEKPMGADIVLGEGEAKFVDKASVVLEQPWHYDTADSQKYTLAQPNRPGDPSPPPAGAQTCVLKPVLNVVIPTPARLENLKLPSRVTSAIFVLLFSNSLMENS